MARIRTIKPDFFTSEDICALSPMARLFFQATWCESDKEGRLEWKPGTMKLRYFPADDCNIFDVADEVVSRGLVVIYEADGKIYAYIPSFVRHQHINPRETASSIPSPPTPQKTAIVDDASSTRGDASERVNSRFDAQGGREGKGKEGKGKEKVIGSSLEVVTPREEILDQLPSSELVKLGNACLEAVGHDPARFIGNFGTVDAWLNSGFGVDEIKAAAVALAARPGFVPPGNPMAWLAKAMPDEIARQRRAAEKDKVDELGLPVEPEIDWKNHPAYRGVI